MSDSFIDKRKQDLSYLNYMIKHKLGVADAGLTLGIPIATIVKHDWSKFRPEIWEPHRDYFYSSQGITGTNDRETYLKYINSRQEHFLNEPGHHNLNKTIDEELESVADWYAVYKAQTSDPLSFKLWWYFNKNRVRHQLSNEAVQKVELSLL